jgi:hypothetical protein
MKITDSLDEQRIIEALIEESKPLIPAGCEHLDFLLMTPFRYSASNPTGTRFRRPNALRGVFYAAAESATAIAEIVFYRLLFFAESPKTPWPQNPGEYTAFAADFSSERTLDLSVAPFANHGPLYDLVNYSCGQALSDQARDLGAEILKYTSVRDSRCLPNFAILEPSAFVRPEVVDRQSWKLHLDSNGARAVCELPTDSIEFDRNAFSKDPRMIGFAWDR